MNRNVENWLKAAIFVIGGIGGFGISIWGLIEFHKSSPEYFNYTAVGLFVLVFLFALIKIIKDYLDDEDNWDEYYDKTYPTHAKKEKETHKEFMERLDDAWVRDFGKKETKK